MFNQNELNLPQIRCLELLMYYDMIVLYHPGKANMVAGALSRLSMSSVAHVDEEKKQLVFDIYRFAKVGVQLADSTKDGVMVHDVSESSYVMDVKAKKGFDPIMIELKEVVLMKSIESFFQVEMVSLNIKAIYVIQMSMICGNKS